MKQLVLFVLTVLASLPAHPQRSLSITLETEQTPKKVALVIGNSAYKTSPLKNAANDAQDTASTLEQLGFKVSKLLNTPQREMNRAITKFGEQLDNNTVALFYYAGHGIQVRDKNYLIPIDAEITSEESVNSESINLDTILEKLSNNPLNIVILDACRNNPFENRFRSMGGGLARLDAPKGTLIAYSTAPGKVAMDGDQRNSIYTKELIRAMQQPGLPIEQVFKQVRNRVISQTSEAQTPWESSSLTGDFYFKAPQKTINQETSPTTSHNSQQNEPAQTRTASPTESAVKLWRILPINTVLGEKISSCFHPSAHYQGGATTDNPTVRYANNKSASIMGNGRIGFLGGITNTAYFLDFTMEIQIGSPNIILWRITPTKDTAPFQPNPNCEYRKWSQIPLPTPALNTPTTAP